MRLRSIWFALLVFCLFAASDRCRAQQWLPLAHPLTPELRAIAEQFFRNDPKWKRRLSLEMSGIPVDLDHDVAGALADIDDDGAPEAFFLFDQPDWCGSDGCTLAILRKHGKTWREICVTSAFEDRVKILESKDHGFHRIVIGYELTGKLDVLNWRHGKCVGEDD